MSGEGYDRKFIEDVLNSYKPIYDELAGRFEVGFVVGEEADLNQKQVEIIEQAYKSAYGQFKTEYERFVMCAHHNIIGLIVKLHTKKSS